MAKKILLAAHCTIDSDDYSAYLDSIELELESEAKDVTTYGSAGWKEFLGGLKSGSLKLKWKQEFTATVDGAMFALLGTVVTFSIRADQAAVGATNPSYSGSILVQAWNPLTGSVGDDATVSTSFPTSGAVARATS